MRRKLGRRRPDRVVAHVHRLPTRERSHPHGPGAARQVERLRGAREDRRVVAVERVGELRDVARGADSASSGTSNCCPSGRANVKVAELAVGDPETVEHLGGQREVRRQSAEVRVVVARDERLDELEDLRDRRSVDRDETAADERRVRGVDDVQRRPRSRTGGAGTGGAREYAPDRPGRAPCARSAGRAARSSRSTRRAARRGRGSERAARARRPPLEALRRDAPKRARVNLLDRRGRARGRRRRSSTGADGRACAAATNTTMASGTRSRPGIRMAWDDVLSDVTCQD